MNLGDYGERYLSEDKFIDYCKDCEIDKVYNNLDMNLLLDFERAKIFIPDFIITRPKDFVQWDETVGQNFGVTPPFKFESILNLINSFKYWHHSNQLFHPFDKKRTSQYLRIPLKHKYVSRVYKIKIRKNELEFRNNIRFYSYWNAYKLYDLINAYTLKYFSKIYRNRKIKSYYNYDLIIRNIKNIDIPSNPEVILCEYNKWAKYFDFLSFFVQAIKNCHTTYFPIPSEQLKLYSLSDEDYNSFINHRERRITIISSEKFEITEDEVFNFLKFLTNKYFEFEKKHRTKLCTCIRNDIFYLIRFIKLKFNYEIDNIYNRVGTVNSTWYKHPLEYIAEGKFALARERLFRGIKNEIENEFKFADITIDENSIERFIQYCKNKHLSIIFSAIYDVDWTDRDYYSIINNLTLLVINYERFIKTILNDSTVNEASMLPVLKKYFANASFVSYLEDNGNWSELTSARSTELDIKIKRIENFAKTISVEYSNIVSSVFYVAVLRNFISHYHNEISFLHVSPDRCFEKVMAAYWMTWKYAEKNYPDNIKF